MVLDRGANRAKIGGGGPCPHGLVLQSCPGGAMSATEAETVADVDEALAYMAGELFAAKVTKNTARAEVVLRYIDKTLDRRLELAPS